MIRVLFAGPDGSGKTTVADLVADGLRVGGRDVARRHARPGILFGGPEGDGAPVTDPHGGQPRGGLASVLKLLLYAVDHLLGALHDRRRDGLLLAERGYHDVVVDPTRYRVPVGLKHLAERCGRIVPRHDVVVLLQGDPSAMVARKPEIDVAETTRQLAEWERLAPRAGRTTVRVDTTELTPEEAASVVLLAIEETSP